MKNELLSQIEVLEQASKNDGWIEKVVYIALWYLIKRYDAANPWVLTQFISLEIDFEDVDYEIVGHEGNILHLKVRAKVVTEDLVKH